MSHLIQFIENVRRSLSAEEWVFFNARYIERKTLVESVNPAFRGNPADMQQSVLRKLREGSAS